ncbi:hypothetical protein QV65_08700 [Rhodococcus erythropolis]|nr:hypothetical protein QV65_08700 [Rhodococcus erythropolis]
MRQNARGSVSEVLQAGCLQSLLDLGEHTFAPSEQVPRRATGSRRDVEILQHREFFEDACRLEGSPDAEAGDLVNLLAE